MKAMRVLTLLSIALFVTGAALLYQGMAREGGQVYLFLFFPVFVVSGPLSALGSLLIFLSIVLGFLSLVIYPPRRGDLGTPPEAPPGSPMSHGDLPRKGRWGGVLLLGPIPIVFGSDVKLTTVILILALALTAALVILYL